MKGQRSSPGVNDIQDKPAIALGPRIVASGGFTLLYRDGMALIEEVAAYLDGEGRTASRGLSREAAHLYATESMRLTTRLMQLASWLLLQRAVNEGEMTAENARTEKEKVRFSASPGATGGPGFDELPEQLRTYMASGERLFERVKQFDRLERGGIAETAPAATEGSIGDQLSRLRAAFGRLQG
jgi:regulator of CtrA degradation